MVSLAMANEGEFENATEIIEESSHIHSKRDSAFNDSSNVPGHSKTDEVAMLLHGSKNYKATRSSNEDLS